MTGGAARPTRHAVLGEAGLAPALILAAMATIVAVIAIAGTGAVAAAGNQAVRAAVAQAPAADMGTLVSADLQVGPGSGGAGGSGQAGGPGAGQLTTAQIRALTGGFAADLPSPGLFAPAQRWAGLIVPARFALAASAHGGPATASAPRTDAEGRAETIEVAYRTDLADHAVVISGALPTGRAALRPGQAGRGGSVTLAVAVTTACARVLGVRGGSLLDLGAARPGGPRIWLRVTGVIRPRAPQSSFWAIAPELRAPVLDGPGRAPYWLAGVFAGPRELAAIAAAYTGDTERAAWFFPLTTAPRAARLGPLENGLAALSAAPVIRRTELAAHAGILGGTSVTSGLQSELGSFSTQLHSTAGTGSVLALGLLAACVAILLVAAGLAVGAYRPELALLRVRGASLAQIGGRMLIRSCCLILPGLAAGTAIAELLLPGSAGAGPASWALVGATALVSLAAVPLLAVLTSRTASARRDATAAAARPGRSGPRRLVAEATVLVAAAGVVAELRLRGLPGTAAGDYLSAGAVLIALTVGLVVNRAYHTPVRALAGVALARRGAVGAVGLTRAALSGAGSMLALLALLLTLTLTVFGAMVATAISTGQRAGSWDQVGADATVTAQGTASVSAADLRAARQVPGVTAATAVYSATGQGALAVTLAAGPSGRTAGIVTVSPAGYAALAARTPWPAFPARALAPPVSGTAPAPVLVSPGLASFARQAADGRGLSLEYGGSAMPVRIVGTIGPTAAMPGGGAFVVLPAWATPRLPTLPPPSAILLTGRSIDARALRVTARRVLPGSIVRVRQAVLSNLASAPALQPAERLYGAGTAVAATLSVLILVFFLATAGRGRAAMLTRLAALGMAGRQVALLSVTEAIPLIWAAAAGTIASAWLLAALIGPVLGLNAFTGTSAPTTLRPTWPDLVVPLAGATIVAVAFLAIDGIRAARRDIGAALRTEEAD
ncbi:MAG: hypothetical protein M0030_12420 [Actinomycetota bacterium]|nr:hypothetical protein [Actinomycetota bacterium]